jgi:nitrate reductase alpha subunit
MNNRTYPRASSYEQAARRAALAHQVRAPRVLPHRARVHRAGENLVVYREPVDSTFHEPNVIVVQGRTRRSDRRSRTYGLKTSTDLSTETRQVRNVLMSADEIVPRSTRWAQGFTHIYHTPKYRHGAHTTPVDTDFTGVFFGPFGDVYRHDKRMPSMTEGYVDINPSDARAHGRRRRRLRLDRRGPVRPPLPRREAGHAKSTRSRACCSGRATTPARPRGRPHLAQHVRRDVRHRVEGHETRADGLAKNPETNYQAMYRYGSHQSATRAWLKPDVDDRDARAQGHVRAGSSTRGFLPTSTARWARRARRS